MADTTLTTPHEPEAPMRRRPARILRVIARLNLGGPAHHVRLLSTRLSPQRYQTLLVAGRVGPGEEELEAVAQDPDLRLLRLDALTPELDPRADTAALAGLVRMMRAFRPDIVHTHTAKAGLLGRLAARLALGRSAVVVHTYHGHVLEGYFGSAQTRLYRGLERAAARLSDQLIGVSQATVDDLVRLRVADRDRFAVVPLGLDLDALLGLGEDRDRGFRDEAGAGPGDLLATFMGRLVPIKRVDVLLLALARARDDGVAVRLAVVGGGPDEEELRALAVKLGVADDVYFAGYRDDVPRILAGSDLAVLSSANEGTPVALIEAGAAGLPLVATDVGGVRDVVVPGAGSVVPAGDVEGLAAALAQMATDPEIRRTVGARAREHVRRSFAAERLLSDIDDLYRELLGRSPESDRDPARPR